MNHADRRPMSMYRQFVNNYFILASTAARLSVFWNKALMSCLISLGENSEANGPLPSDQRSLISCRLLLSTSCSSMNLDHSDTCLWSSAFAIALLLISSSVSCELVEKSVVPLSSICLVSKTSLRAASVEMSSSTVMWFITSEMNELNRMPEPKRH